jgi:hypothetical protein
MPKKSEGKQMENMNLIDETQYFAESKKAIQLVLENEKLLGSKVGLRDKLRLVKESKEHTKSLEEYEALEKQEKELERKIRFNQFTEPAVPVEHREKLKRNAVTEQLEADKKLNELKAELKERIEYLESEVIPLVDSIMKLESMRKIPDQVDMVLNAELGETVPFPLSYRLRVLNQTPDETQAGKALKDLDKVVKALKRIEVPIETKGLLDFLKRSKK